MVLYIINPHVSGKVQYIFEEHTKTLSNTAATQDIYKSSKLRLMMNSDVVINFVPGKGAALLKSRYQDTSVCKPLIPGQLVHVPFPDTDIFDYTTPLTYDMIEALFWVGEDSLYEFMKNLHKNYDTIAKNL